jgi:hypothetical protein
MASTLMQTIEETVSDPTVTYDTERMTITLSVIVSLAEGAKDVTIMAAPVTIPKDTWTLIWNLVVDTPGLVADFANPGIVLLPPLPPKVTVVAGPSAVSSTRWTATFKNEVLTTNTFSYDIAIDWSYGATKVLGQTTIHDPTIVVTKDPIG